MASVWVFKRARALNVNALKERKKRQIEGAQVVVGLSMAAGAKMESHPDEAGLDFRLACVKLFGARPPGRWD